MASSLPLTVNGKTYTVPSPPARVGLAMQAAYAISLARRADIEPPAHAVERAARYADPDTPVDQEALGPVWDAMIDDDVTIEDLRRAARAAFAWIVTGSETAAAALMAAGDDDADAADIPGGGDASGEA